MISLAELKSYLLSLPRTAKCLIAAALDAALCILAVWLALCLRLEEWIPLTPIYWRMAFESVGLLLPIFTLCGLYRTIFRYAGWNAMLAIAKAMAIYASIYSFIFTFLAVPSVPRSLGIIQPLLLLVLIIISRLLTRTFLSHVFTRRSLQGTLIYGAGASGRQLAAALARSHERRLLGFLDDNPQLHKKSIDGRRIYNPRTLPNLISRLHVTEILLAMPSVPRHRRHEILNTLQTYALHVRTLPGLSDLASGRVRVTDLREPDIEDLLGRDPVRPNALLLNRHTRHKTVLVTGAGGSIGSELCRHILRHHPKTLILVEHNEFALYTIHRELCIFLSNHPECRSDIHPYLACVKNESRMTHIIQTHKPHTFFHAAAYKHVPLVEQNPAEGVLNNVLGTWICARTAALYNVSSFVLISTDKAVRPPNIMGASKRLAEMVLQALAKTESATCFSMVRFGNVLGSSGSVVPLFRSQIKNGGPLTVTHPDVTRYFMTIPEAVELVIQAAALAKGGDVFVLDMGEPVRIYDLAKRMIELSGLKVRGEENPDGDIDIEFIGLRPGEKLHEELLIGNNPEPTRHPRIMRAHEDSLPLSTLESKLQGLMHAALMHDETTLKRILQETITGFESQSCDEQTVKHKIL
jgi:FlaA1/EpsC-like NDP-sugar epimerase